MEKSLRELGPPSWTGKKLDTENIRSSMIRDEE